MLVTIEVSKSEIEQAIIDKLTDATCIHNDAIAQGNWLFLNDEGERLQKPLNKIRITVKI